MDKVTSILLAGVGGQGTILVSKVLTTGLLQAGYDVKMSEVHVMDQRGGSVSSHVRYGKKVYSPIIGRGAADILVSFEKMEAVRYSEYLKPDGIAVINDYEMPSLPIATGQMPYPEGTLEAMEKAFKTIRLNAGEIAIGLGNPKCMNIVLFGAMVKALKMDEVDWPQVLREQIPPKLLELNLKAYEAGRGCVQD